MRAERGFTLVDAVITVGLAAVLLGMAVLRLASLLDGVRLAGAARTVATTLRLARGTAIRADSTTEVRFDPARRVCETRDRDGTLLETRSLPAGVFFAGLPARGRIAFGGLGTGENGTVTLAAGTRVRHVIVNQRGRVRLS